CGGERGREGGHGYPRMCLVALEDRGLTVFPTHRVISGLDEERLKALGDALRRDFIMTEVPVDEIAPPAGEGPLELGYIDGREKRAFRLTLRDQAIADAALPGRSRAYRPLDTGVLQAVILKGALGLSAEDIAHFN